MKITKAYKLSLREKEIFGPINSYIGENKIEIQLLNKNDNFSYIDNYKDRIVSIHSPLDYSEEKPACNISTLIDAIYHRNGYYDYYLKMFEIASKLNVGVVIHGDISDEELMYHPGF